MANRKEYEMLFALNASLNGNFQGTFSKAQQEFAKLGREIQDLQKLQANVSSYQKQEQAIASSTTKLSNLQQQHDLLQREINETTGSTSGLEREKLKLEQRIKDPEAALDRQKQKLETTSQKLQAPVSQSRSKSCKPSRTELPAARPTLESGRSRGSRPPRVLLRLRALRTRWTRSRMLIWSVSPLPQTSRKA